MFLSLREMEIRKVRFDTTFRPGEIEFFDKNLWQEGSLTAIGTAEIVPRGLNEIRVHGSLKVVMVAECDRCLEPARYPLDINFDLLYQPVSLIPKEPEVGIEEEESLIAFYEGDGLLLEDILREQILLALPMQRLCRPDCRGLCPVCGENRNFVTCQCQIKGVDDRWAALRMFRL